jgi:glycosyltransferase involved in cell wall biosynthesis
VKNIIVITKNFGDNFTGATKATCVYLQMLEERFDRVEVFCLHTGKHRLKKAVIHQQPNLPSLFTAVRRAARGDRDALFLSDDHFGFLLRFLSVRYLHIYHGNWPHARSISLMMFLKSFYFIPLYTLTILFAKTVAHVSYYMESSWRAWNDNTVIIRNGIRPVAPQVTRPEKGAMTRVIMVGNIDKRKYGLAPRLFSLLQQKGLADRLQIDIYGNSLDAGLENTLRQYNFVNVKGYQPDFSFQEYDIFLSLSSGENLSIAICEALGNATPVICFNVGGLIEVVRNGENGYLIRKGKINEVATVLGNVINSGRRFTFRAHDLDDFSWQLSAERLYNTLIDLRS